MGRDEVGTRLLVLIGRTFRPHESRRLFEIYCSDFPPHTFVRGRRNSPDSDRRSLTGVYGRRGDLRKTRTTTSLLSHRLSFPHLPGTFVPAAFSTIHVCLGFFGIEVGHVSAQCDGLGLKFCVEGGVNASTHGVRQ